MKKLTALITAVLVCGGVMVKAGTLTLKDGSSVSDITVVSIEDDRITIEKDKTRKIIPMSKVKGYYHTDIKGAGSLEGDVADYKVTISKVEMPEYAAPKKGEKKSKSNDSCVINYRITREGENSNIQRVKAPYFYLYLLLGGDEEYGHRGVKLFCYPAKEAKPKQSSKGYDRAAILALLGNFDRPIVHFENMGLKFSDRKAVIPLKGLPRRKIIAYHIEVYGNSDMILEKDERSIDAHISPKSQWWKEL